MDKLKPCPFCGGEAYLKNEGTICCYVACSKCHAGTRLCGDGLIAFAAWNRRSNDGNE